MAVVSGGFKNVISRSFTVKMNHDTDPHQKLLDLQNQEDPYQLLFKNQQPSEETERETKEINTNKMLVSLKSINIQNKQKDSKLKEIYTAADFKRVKLDKDKTKRM